MLNNQKGHQWYQAKDFVKITKVGTSPLNRENNFITICSILKTTEDFLSSNTNGENMKYQNETINLCAKDKKKITTQTSLHFKWQRKNFYKFKIVLQSGSFYWN